mmetsp:Transcript_9135/g.28326  ORF Transcript_9135/g.28326 Transcript_9135/m.28326 type:complete len:287 (+) Transcript_9135:278-1138(+)
MALWPAAASLSAPPSRSRPSRAQSAETWPSRWGATWCTAPIAPITASASWACGLTTTRSSLGRPSPSPGSRSLTARRHSFISDIRRRSVQALIQKGIQSYMGKSTRATPRSAFVSRLAVVLVVDHRAPPLFCGRAHLAPLLPLGCRPVLITVVGERVGGRVVVLVHHVGVLLLHCCCHLLPPHHARPGAALFGTHRPGLALLLAHGWQALLVPGAAAARTFVLVLMLLLLVQAHAPKVVGTPAARGALHVSLLRLRKPLGLADLAGALLLALGLLCLGVLHRDRLL